MLLTPGENISALSALTRDFRVDNLDDRQTCLLNAMRDLVDCLGASLSPGGKPKMEAAETLTVVNELKQSSA